MSTWAQNLGSAVAIAARTVKIVVTPKSKFVTEYENLWKTARLRNEYAPFIDIILKKLLPGRDKYEAVVKTIGNGMPWWFVALCHAMEAGAKKNPFDYHLHCGDPLTARTVNVPAGRPRFNPKRGALPPSPTNPYTWEESAWDCLVNRMGYHTITDWSIGNALYLFEKFNGTGYRARGVNTPYVWSYTNHYGTPPNIGKYVTDGVFKKYDAAGRPQISQQAGCAAYLLRMKERGLLSI